jgi:toxin ParE1/3/4
MGGGSRAGPSPSGQHTAMRLIVRSTANIDIVAAAEYYEDRRVGLGNDFFHEVEATFHLLQHHPRLGQPLARNGALRRFQLKRFPYQIIYLLSHKTIIIRAVTHQNRHPNAWWNRIQEAPAVYHLAA